MMTMFDWMLDGGTHGRLDVVNSRMDALIEGQRETNATLREGFKGMLEKAKRRCPDGAAQHRSKFVREEIGRLDGWSCSLCRPAARI